MDTVFKWVQIISDIYPFGKSAATTCIRTIGINNDSYKIVLYGFPVFYVYKKNNNDEYDILFTINERDICGDAYATEITVDDIIALLKNNMCTLSIYKTVYGHMQKNIEGTSTLLMTQKFLVYTYSRKEMQGKTINFDNTNLLNFKYKNPLYKLGSETKKIINLEYNNFFAQQNYHYILYEINNNYILEIIEGSTSRVTIMSNEFVLANISDLAYKKIISVIFQKLSFYDWLSVFASTLEIPFSKQIEVEKKIISVNINTIYEDNVQKFSVSIANSPIIIFALAYIDFELLTKKMK